MARAATADHAACPGSVGALHRQTRSDDHLGDPYRPAGRGEGTILLVPPVGAAGRLERDQGHEADEGDASGSQRASRGQTHTGSHCTDEANPDPAVTPQIPRRIVSPRTPSADPARSGGGAANADVRRFRCRSRRTTSAPRPLRPGQGRPGRTRGRERPPEPPTCTSRGMAVAGGRSRRSPRRRRQLRREGTAPQRSTSTASPRTSSSRRAAACRGSDRPETSTS